MFVNFKNMENMFCRLIIGTKNKSQRKYIYYSLTDRYCKTSKRKKVSYKNTTFSYKNTVTVCPQYVQLVERRSIYASESRDSVKNLY